MEKSSWMAGGKIVNVRRVQWITMPDAQTAVNALAAGEIEIPDNTTAETADALETEIVKVTVID